MWSEWTRCATKDGTERGCWNSLSDPPKSRRHALCKNSKTAKICNEETRNCNELPVCFHGNAYFHLKINKNDQYIENRQI